MKKFGFSVLAASMLLSLTGLTSCVSETETAGAGQATVTTRSVVFNISLPTGDPVHVGTRAIQEAGEYSISSLNMLVFDAATDVLKSVVPIDLSSATATASGNDYRYTYTWEPTAGSTCRFLFVANEVHGLTANTSTWDDALAAVSGTDHTLSAGGNLATVFSTGLPMTGVAYYNVGSARNEFIPIADSESANITVSVDLTRVVARVDIYNRTPNLHITGIRLVHANPQSYLLPHKDASNNVVIPTGMTKVGGAADGLLPYNDVVDAVNDYHVSLAHPLTGAADGGTPLKKAFYVYEDDIYENAAQAALEAEALALQVTGKLVGNVGDDVASGVDVFYQIPFTDLYKEGGSDDGKSVEIRRNNLYKVKIGDGTAVPVNGKIRTSLEVSDWVDDGFSSVFEDAVFTSAPADGVGSYNRATRLVTLASNAAVASGDLSIDVTDTYKTTVGITSVEVNTTGSTWVAAADASDWLGATVAGDGKSVGLTATANDASGAAARIGSVRITYTYTEDGQEPVSGKIVFSVMQPETTPAP